MKALSPEELRELRKEISSLGICPSRLDEVIHLIDSIVISWIDQAFGFHLVQLSLAARANYAFAGSGECGNLTKFHENEISSPGSGAKVIPETPTTKPQP